MNEFLLSVLVPMDDNPLNGIVPNFSIFGAEFTQWWQKLIAGLWGIAIVLSVIFIIVAATKMSAASGATGNPMEYKAARGQFVGSLIALGILASLAVIVGAILAITAH